MSARYSAVAIGLHWAIAILLLGNIFLGWNMFTKDDIPVENLYQLHKSIGITVLVLSIARISWRIFNPAPSLPHDMASHEKALSHFVHYMFYAAMLIIPITGWVLVSASNFSVATVLYGVVPWPHLPILPELSSDTKDAIFHPIEFIHSKFSWVVLALVAMHVAGAIKHQFGGEDGVLKRMIPFMKNTTRPAKSNGAWVTFGGASALFLAVSYLPGVISDFSRADQPVSAIAGTVEPNWVVDYDQSYIEFSGIHDGAAFSGRFTDWRTDIAFDTENLAGSNADVYISASSARTGKQLYDNTLKASEWFDLANFAMIEVALSNFRNDSGGYLADANVSLKGQPHTVPFVFKLDETGDITTMTGSTTVTRAALNLGQQSDAKGEWVSLEIDISVKVVASPTE